MSEERDPMNGWKQFHEREVLLQLKTPYVGVNPDNMLPQTQMNEKGEQIIAPNGAPVLSTTPFMQGTLFVEEDAGGLVLKLGKRMGTNADDLPVFLLTAIASDAIAFCTTYETRRIVTR